MTSPQHAQDVLHNDDQPVVLSYGMGLESTAILVRWLLDPDSRPFPLQRLLVVTAHLGSEFQDTLDLVSTHVLPLLREHQVRYAQVARAAVSQTEGIVVLSDTRTPDRLYHEGAYRLYDELLTRGTVPQVGGTRLCSLKNKGFPLDRFIEQALHGQSYHHVIGFNCNETRRVEKDRSFGGSDRNVWYPLLDWQWGREECQAYLRSALGLTHDFPKSCCEFCPFTMGREDILERYRRFPNAAARALRIEMVSRALNPRQTLYGSASLLEKIQGDGNQAAMDAFQTLLATHPWAVYRLRRLWSASGNVERCVERLHTGTRDEALDALRQLALDVPVDITPTEDGLSWRLVLRPKAPTSTGRQREEAYVLAPATVLDKTPYGKFDRFEARWTDWLAELDLFAA